MTGGIYYLRDLGEDMDDDELRAMIDEFDADADGESEFLAILAKLTASEPHNFELQTSPA